MIDTKHINLISQEDLDSIPVFNFKRSKDALKHIQAIAHKKIFECEYRIVNEAEGILLKWLSNALDSDKIDLAKEISIVQSALSTASLIFHQALTYEAMEHCYKSQNNKQANDIIDLHCKISEMEKQIERLKDGI